MQVQRGSYELQCASSPPQVVKQALSVERSFANLSFSVTWNSIARAMSVRLKSTRP
jgi:hypothetical protein